MVCFLPPQSVFFIFTANFCLPSQIWIISGIHTYTLGKQKRSFLPELLVGRQPYTTVSRSHCYSTFKMQFYSIVISILCRFPPGKWVPLCQTVEGGSKIRLLHGCPMASSPRLSDKWGHHLWHRIIWRLGVTQRGVGWIHQRPPLSSSVICPLLSQGGREGLPLQRSKSSTVNIYKYKEEQVLHIHSAWKSKCGVKTIVR